MLGQPHGCGQSGRAVGAPVVTAPGRRMFLAVRADRFQPNNVWKLGHKIKSDHYTEDSDLPLPSSIEQQSPYSFPGL